MTGKCYQGNKKSTFQLNFINKPAKPTLDGLVSCTKKSPTDMIALVHMKISFIVIIQHYKHAWQLLIHSSFW